ncbi:TSL-kinase interacting protein 1-like [Curcuma longa]|uniref:TSL-kinase interacting protein 1-like n=1 Tax=Curcuma longa TaxID=136217 RepID=UPI003D9E0973
MIWRGKNGEATSGSTRLGHELDRGSRGLVDRSGDGSDHTNKANTKITMKTSHQRRKATTASGTKDFLGCNNPDSTKIRKQKQKIAGNNNSELGGQILNSIQMNHMVNQDSQTKFVETVSEDLESLQRKQQDSCGKLKLQLFPIDEKTKEILEQDNVNPYLELTLTTRKKISSVVKHLNNKWGRSKLASGKLMLFPNNVCLDNLADSRKWSLEDSNLTAADVHASLGNPAVFRLRYGWLNVDQTKQPASPTLACSDILRKNNYFGGGNDNDIKICSVSSKEHGQCLTDNSVNQTIQAPISEKVIKNVVDQNPLKTINTSWIDCVTGISFGAILSKVSDTPINADHPSHSQNSALHQIPITCDSFDIAIAELMRGRQSSNPSSRMAPLSILEAEETCHPFPLTKAAPSSLDVPASSPFVSPTMEHTNMLDSQVQVSLAHNYPAPAPNPQLHDVTDACAEPKSGLQFNSLDRLTEGLNAHAELQTDVQHNETHQFGGMNLLLPDPLGGPLEIVVAPSSKNMNDGENQTIGLDGLITSSMDAFHNFSIF